VIEIQTVAQGVLVKLHAQPGARRNQIVGEHNGALRVAVTTPPDKGKANEAILALLSEFFHLPKSAISLVRGTAHRQKTFLLQGLDEDTVRQSIGQLPDSGQR